MSTPADQRRERMVTLWGLTLDAFKARLEADADGNLSASYMETICGFLNSSGISAETQEEAREAVADLAMEKLAADIRLATEDVNAEPPEPPTPKPAEAVAPLERPFDTPPAPRA